MSSLVAFSSRTCAVIDTPPLTPATMAASVDTAVTAVDNRGARIAYEAIIGAAVTTKRTVETPVIAPQANLFFFFLSFNCVTNFNSSSSFSSSITCL